MRKSVLLLLAVLVLAGCGAGSARLAHLTLLLDWTPNPDHVGFYYARDAGLFRDAGLDVSIHAPSDPAAPLKLVAAGTSDLAVSYEQEVLIAAEKGLPVVAVAAVVGRPLNSFMAIDPQIDSLDDLRGRTIGVTGVPADYAALDAALGSVGLARTDVAVVTVGYNLLPALLSHKVDAVLGVYRNVEGIDLAQRGFHPTVIPLDRAGVPTYDELVLVASSTRLRDDSAYRDRVGQFVTAFLSGEEQARAHPRRALGILAKVTASSASFLSRATPATLALLPGRTGGIGCLEADEWAVFGQWMVGRNLLPAAVPVREAMSMRFLPSRCRA